MVEVKGKGTISVAGEKLKAAWTIIDDPVRPIHYVEASPLGPFPYTACGSGPMVTTHEDQVTCSDCLRVLLKQRFEELAGDKTDSHGRAGDESVVLRPTEQV